MILSNLRESDLYDAVFAETEEEIVAYDIMAHHTDIVFNNRTYNLSISYDTESHLFKVRGDMVTEWIDAYDLRNLLSCCDNDLWGLPSEDEGIVICYAGRLLDDLVRMEEDCYEG